MIWFWIILTTAALTLFATLNLSLHTAVHSRLAERLEKATRRRSPEEVLRLRRHFVHSTALLRSTATLALTVMVLYDVGALQPNSSLLRLVLGSLLALVFILIFGAAIPHAWAKYGGAELFVQLHPLLTLIRLMLYPLLRAMDVFDTIVRRLADVPAPDAQSVANEMEQEILSAVSEGEMLGAVDEEEKEMIESVIELGDKHVEQIMTPRTEIAAVPDDATIDTVLQTIRSAGHSRIPVYHETIDSILGIIYAKDLLFRDDRKPFEAKKSMRAALFVPESKLVRDLLREFREKKVHIAIVLDEYGGTVGLATIEDILEELVGEIDDEFDVEGPAELKRIDAETVEVDARMRIEDLNDMLKITLPENPDYETLGGFVSSTMGKIPKIGEGFEHDSIGIQIIGAEPQRITRVRLRMKNEPKQEVLEA